MVVLYSVMDAVCGTGKYTDKSSLMSIEWNEPIKFREKGTLEAVTRCIATHRDGVADWFKNVRRQYQWTGPLSQKIIGWPRCCCRMPASEACPDSLGHESLATTQRYLGLAQLVQLNRKLLV
jgi:hypothetical protein